MQIKLPGETVLSLKKEVEKLSEEDKATLNRWYDEEQESTKKDVA